MNDQQKKVIVLGAGIGGLTVAHELSRRGFAVTVYERNDIVGGLARSKYYTDQSTDYKYPVEYSWRVYGTGYLNLLRLLKEIPLKNKINLSVFDNLVKVSSYIFPRFNKKEITIGNSKDNVADLMEDFDKHEIWSVINKITECMTMSTERIDSLDHMTWAQYCNDLSAEARKYMVRIWGPVLGMDPTHMSFPVVARIVPVLLGGIVRNASSLFLLNSPTNEGWFDQWLVDLKNNGVQIKNNYEILDLTIGTDKIDKIKIKNLASGEVFEDSGDYIVCGLPVEAVAKIVVANSDLLNIPSLQKTINLARISRQIQLSVQLFLDQKIIYPTGHSKNVLYLPDTPWAIIIEDESDVWDKTYSTDPRVKSVHSVGICQTDVAGILFNKKFIDCTPDEVKQEVWAQICKSYQMANIKTESGETIEKANIVLFYIWDTYAYTQNKENTWEPKFSNNANGLQYMPGHTTELENFFFATAYTKTQRFIYSMESAAEAGTLAANEIMIVENKNNGIQYFPTKIFGFNTSPVILRPLQWLDKKLFQSNLPHANKLFMGNSIALTILYLLLPLLLIFLLILK